MDSNESDDVAYAYTNTNTEDTNNVDYEESSGCSGCGGCGGG